MIPHNTKGDLFLVQYGSETSLTVETVSAYI